jgi:lipoate-protein ligase A
MTISNGWLQMTGIPNSPQTVGFHWRFIDTGPCDGPTNMAIDEALLSCFDPAESFPVLRLYGWSPAALSLGRYQKAEEALDLDLCRAAGVPLVRRITGGGIIYHAAELTYSLVCAPHHLPPAASIKESFRILTSFLLTLYRNLGLNASYAVDRLPPGSPLGERTPFCFAGKESYDILINGRKIGGNAQRRLKNTIFQHGSIPLENMTGTGVRFLREIPMGVSESTTSLGEEGVGLGMDRLRERLKTAFAESLGTAMETGTMTTEERAVTTRLLEKYRRDEWNVGGTDGE